MKQPIIIGGITLIYKLEIDEQKRNHRDTGLKNDINEKKQEVEDIASMSTRSIKRHHTETESEYIPKRLRLNMN